MNHTRLSFSKKRMQWIILVMLCVTPIIGMTVDLIAPSLPAITKDLNVPATIVKNMISIYMLGYAIGNFFTGFLSDAWGRQKLLRFGFCIFVVASLLPVFYPDINTLLLSRFVQGVAIGNIAVIARTIYSDLLTPEKLLKLGVVLGSLFSLGPVIGPLLGGYLQVYFGWQACFIFFAVVMAVLGAAIFFIVPETNLNCHPLDIYVIRRNAIEILKNKKFMALALIMGAIYSMIITFNTVGPFFIQTHLHYSPIFFGHIALFLGMSLLTATFICRYLLTKRGFDWLLLYFLHSFFVLSIIGLCLGYIFGDNIILITIISAIMFFAGGFTFPMSAAKGLSMFQHIAGTATAIMYLINILMTSLTGFILSFITINNIVSLIAIYVALLFFCVLVYWLLIHSKYSRRVYK